MLKFSRKHYVFLTSHYDSASNIMHTFKTLRCIGLRGGQHIMTWMFDNVLFLSLIHI